MKVITFSRYFPVAHPRKGEPTYFVRSIWEGLDIMTIDLPLDAPELENDIRDYYIKPTYTPKYHTIRGGNRWKVGDWFSPRIWSGKPYASKQIEIAPPIQIKKIWDIKMNLLSRPFWKINGEGLDNKTVDLLASNDGLTYEDFKSWFTCGRPQIHSPFFEGQILCWNENIDYLPNNVPNLEVSDTTGDDGSNAVDKQKQTN